jgi:hypothetical protein
MKETEGTIAQETLGLVFCMSRAWYKNFLEDSKEYLLGNCFHHILHKAEG